ncbi:uncharacterized protein LOC111608947 isoform X2 [Xiphophorus maculatus]|uniref:uncharacterized protein LOC111608947 isoform X2 n=1 Tax=Xiphophorus maculatus TaxID=8083 RepID=UPI000C6EEA9A|nr:uncharacterized protein LOC111608947 isoform X2 [Xiphophorus maculatus]
MSEDDSCEGSEPTYDTTDFDVSHSLSIKVEYYRSFEYKLNWTTAMSLRRSSRLKFPQKSPAPDEDVARLRGKSRRGRTRLEETHADESEGRDIVDLIPSNPFAKEGAAREAVGTLSYGLDQSNDESGSESSNNSIDSGPSNLCYDYRGELYSDFCSACHKLYEKAKRLKTPIRSKLLDNDPKSLTCDQWVLMKRWKPKGQPGARQKLLSHIQLHDGLVMRRGDQSSPCSRPHIFLKRNLRRANSTAENQKKKKRSRGRRGSSQGSRVAKQKRLQNNSLHQHTNTKGKLGNPNRLSTMPSFCSDSDPGAQISPETEGCSKNGVTELVPSSAALKAPASAAVRAPRRAPKKTCEFRDLLVQLRGNSSMIVRETS